VASLGWEAADQSGPIDMASWEDLAAIKTLKWTYADLRAPGGR
jgi:hypothetical protein